MSDYSITAVARRVVYSGSAGVGPYSFSFPVLVETDIAVYQNSTLLTLTTDYTVSITPSTGTGSVTLVVAATGSDTITITGARAIERTTDFVTAGALLASSLNTELDSQTIFIQQVAEDAGRAIQAPVTDPTSIDMTLPAKADRLGKLLGFNASTGNPEATTGRVLTVNVSDVAVDGGGNSQPATVSYTESTGVLNLGIPTGDTGATGATGAAGAAGADGVGGLPYTFSTTISDADPGAGQIRFNNGTLGSVSQIFIDDSTAASGNPDVSAFILTWDDSTQTSDRGQVTITKQSAQENFATYKISGGSTDASGYVKLAVTHVVSNGSFSNSDAVLVSFVRTGNAGSLADPMTTRGDIIVRDSSNATARLAVGSANTVLKSDGTDASWGYTVGTAANNLVQLNGSAQLPAVSGANLTNLPIIDVSSDVRFLALQVASDRIGLEDGIADPLVDETDIDNSTSTNELFNSAGTYYTGASLTAVAQGAGTALGDMTQQGGLSAAFDSNTAQASSSAAAITSSVSSGNVGKDWGSGVTKIINNVKCYASTDQGFATTSGGGSNVNLTLRLQGSSDNFSSNIVNLSDELSVSSGTTSMQTVTANVLTGHRYHRVLITPASSAQVYFSELEFTENTTANLTLVSNAFTADATPSSSVIGVQVVENESITVNTDLTAEVSRDGGTTFTSCTLVLNTTLGATGTKYYESASTDISSQPSGTSMVYRVKTLNTKDIQVHGVTLKWT